ncbi:MAG TPA: hypothetical protein VD767_12060 [Thermomicrobiales bacterium]|nr:hypothetical protein [Thermomicrobiales bacterium]
MSSATGGATCFRRRVLGSAWGMPQVFARQNQAAANSLARGHEATARSGASGLLGLPATYSLSSEPAPLGSGGLIPG